eukprot:1161189-Pelagomonas_calceolata.AAC.8
MSLPRASCVQIQEKKRLPMHTEPWFKLYARIVRDALYIVIAACTIKSNIQGAQPLTAIVCSPSRFGSLEAHLAPGWRDLHQSLPWCGCSGLTR